MKQTLQEQARRLDEDRWSAAMAAAQQGDRQSYEQLLRELGDAIERYVRGRFGPLACLEDCVQECLLAIHLARHTWNPQRPFRPWLFTIVHNKTIDLLRRTGYAPPRADRAPSATAPGPPAGGDPADEMAPGELLTRLEPTQREALTLTKIQGYTLAEAAARSGVSESAMKSRVARAMRAAAALVEHDRNAP